jgi:hypothetical protein
VVEHGLNGTGLTGTGLTGTGLNGTGLNLSGACGSCRQEATSVASGGAAH